MAGPPGLDRLRGGAAGPPPAPLHQGSLTSQLGSPIKIGEPAMAAVSSAGRR
jgi:hypothetical protein